MRQCFHINHMRRFPVIRHEYQLKFRFQHLNLRGGGLTFQSKLRFQKLIVGRQIPIS